MCTVLVTQPEPIIFHGSWPTDMCQRPFLVMPAAMNPQHMRPNLKSLAHRPAPRGPGPKPRLEFCGEKLGNHAKRARILSDYHVNSKASVPRLVSFRLCAPPPAFFCRSGHSLLTIAAIRFVDSGVPYVIPPQSRDRSGRRFWVGVPG